MNHRREYRQLSREEELDLFARWREQGDRSAYETLVESQLAWARTLATRYCHSSGGRDIDAVESAAYLGVLRAVDKFDPARGYRLTTLVFHGVRSTIHDRDEGGAIRVSRNAKYAKTDAWRRAKRTVPILVKDSDGQLTNQTDVPWHFDQFAFYDEQEENEPVQRQLVEALAALPWRQRTVIESRFFARDKLDQIGQRLGVSKERVRQIERQALRTLREKLGASVAITASAHGRCAQKESPRDGSVARLIWDVIAARGPLRMREIAKAIDVPPKRLSTIISANIGRWFVRLEGREIDNLRRDVA